MDSFRAQIWIGGCIHENLIPGLVEALYEDEASDDFGGATIDKNCTEEQLFAYLDNESLLNLCCEDAELGRFGATENFCTSHDISFNRTSDRYAEYDGEDLYWRPGMKSPIITFFDDNGSEIVRGSPVRTAIDLLKEYFDSRGKNYLEHTCREKAMKLLREVCPEIPEKLKTFCTNNIST